MHACARIDNRRKHNRKLVAEALPYWFVTGFADGQIRISAPGADGQEQPNPRNASQACESRSIRVR